MLFILRLAYASSERIPLTHIGPTFGGAVIVVAAEVVDIRSGVCPDNSISGAMHPCQRFRRILVDARLPLARAVESIRQARPTIALRRGSCPIGGPSILAGSPRTRKPIRQARPAFALRRRSCPVGWGGPSTLTGGPGQEYPLERLGVTRTASARAFPPGLRRRRIGAVIAVGQARATSPLHGRRRGSGKHQYRKKRESNRRFHCLSPAMG